MSTLHVILSGCSGGGKSTLLSELERRGYGVVPEPGRRIVEEELRGSGTALPWIDLSAFAQRALTMAASDRERKKSEQGWVFFDRGLVDAAIALQHAQGCVLGEVLAPFPRYNPKVFMTPPWAEIYVTDNERQHDLTEAVAEYERLISGYRELGYQTIILPKVGVDERADFVLSSLSQDEACAGRPETGRTYRDSN